MKHLEPKKTLNPRLLLMAVAMTASIVSHAFAATPKSESVIAHDQVTLADVFDGVTENANYVLAPAPEMGKAMTLNVNDLSRISEAFNLGWSATGPQQVVIRRAFATIGGADIREALLKKLTTDMNGQKLEVELTDPAVTLRFSGVLDKTVSIEDLKTDTVRGEFRAVVAAGDTKKEVTGKFYSISQLPVLKEALRPGDVIAASDIDYVDLRTTDISPSMVVDASKLIGMTPRRGVASLKPLVAGDVTAPMLIKKGDLVTMTLKSDILLLTTQGRAMEDGAEGAVVKVMNTSSKQVLDAVITGPQAVIVRASTGTL